MISFFNFNPSSSHLHVSAQNDQKETSSSCRKHSPSRANNARVSIRPSMVRVVDGRRRRKGICGTARAYFSVIFSDANHESFWGAPRHTEPHFRWPWMSIVRKQKNDYTTLAEAVVLIHRIPLSNVQQLTFHCTGWLIGILIYNGLL